MAKLGPAGEKRNREDERANGIELDDRQKRIIENCKLYADNDPAGLPGHQLMIIVSKLAYEVERLQKELESNA